MEEYQSKSMEIHSYNLPAVILWHTWCIQPLDVPDKDRMQLCITTKGSSVVTAALILHFFFPNQPAFQSEHACSLFILIIFPYFHKQWALPTMTITMTFCFCTVTFKNRDKLLYNERAKIFLKHKEYTYLNIFYLIIIMFNIFRRNI